MCKLDTFSALYSVPRQDFVGASPLFSGCTFLSAFLSRRVSGENRGGAAEILSRVGVEHGERIQSTHPRVGLGPSFPIRDVRCMHGVSC